MVLTRAAYNALLDTVNLVLTNPPPGCDPLPPLEHAPPNTRLTKSLFSVIHDAIKQTCSTIEFTPIPDILKQSILDEIHTKLGEAWCDCEPECNPDDLIGLDGTRFSLGELPMVFRIGCLGNLPAPTTFLADLITGIQIAPAGFEGLLWRFLANQTVGNVTNYAEHAGDVGFSLFGLPQSDLRFIASGNIDCDGKVVVSGTGPLIPLSGGTNFVNCGNCASESCADAIANGQANVASATPIIYVLEVVVTGGAGCC